MDVMATSDIGRRGDSGGIVINPFSSRRIAFGIVLRACSIAGRICFLVRSSPRVRRADCARQRHGAMTWRHRGVIWRNNVRMARCGSGMTALARAWRAEGKEGGRMKSSTMALMKISKTGGWREK